jgi:hypothetical protein
VTHRPAFDSLGAAMAVKDDVTNSTEYTRDTLAIQRGTGTGCIEADRLNRLLKKLRLCPSERSEESLLVSFRMLKSKRDSSLRSEGQIDAFFRSA